MSDILLALILVAVIGFGSIVANLLILRACQKVYTEYFKDRSMANRAEVKR